MSQNQDTGKGKRTPAVKTRSTVIHRTSADDLRGIGGAGGMRLSVSTSRQSFGPMYPTGTVASASQEGVAKVINTTAEEKTQFQGLNQRLAGYIENAKFADAQLKMLACQLEAEKKKKVFDPTEMKEYYENEIAEYKDVIKTLNEERTESNGEREDLSAKFQDEKEAHKRTEIILEDLRKKIDRLNQQMGDVQGENCLYHSTVDCLEEDKKILQEKIRRQESEIEAQRQNSQREAELKIQAECEKDAIEDKAEFEIQILKEDTGKGKRTPAVKTRSTVIHRTSADDLRGIGGAGGMRLSVSTSRQSFGPMYPTGTVASASQEGVAKVINTTAEEKTQFQGLNQRLAGYIENAKFADAQLKMLACQLEAEKKKKVFDPTEMKEYYENEIAEYKDVIKTLNEERTESNGEREDLSAKFQDEKEAHKRTEIILEDLRKKIDRLNQQMGDVQGENCLYHSTVDCLEEDKKILQEKIRRQESEIEAQRQNSQREAELKIQAECEKDAIEDKAEFEIQILKEQIKELNEMLTNDTVHLDLHNEMKGRIQDVVKEYQQNYQDAMDKLKLEYDNKYQIQLQQMQGLDRKENSQIAKLQSEITKLRNSRSVEPKLSELLAKIKAIEAEKAHIKELYDSECEEHGDDNDKKDNEIAQLKAEMEGIKANLLRLEHSNCDLKNEIETYNKLLTEEENKFGNERQSH